MTRGPAEKWEGVDSGIEGWKVQEKGTMVILTRLHGAERVRIWFSTEHDDPEDTDDEDEGDEDEGDDDEDDDDEGDNDDDDADEQEEDEDEDIDDEDEPTFVTCRISFYKPQMGALLVTALIEEDSFVVRSIAHSYNTRVAMERTAEVEWERQGLYYGKHDDLASSTQDFDDYLLDRGINKQLASYITRYAEEKGEEASTKWLRNIEAFIRN